MIKKLLVIYSLISFAMFTNAQSSQIVVISVSQRTYGSGLVDIYFNMSGPGSTYNISLEVSFNGGSTYTVVPANYLSGDVNSISLGSNKHIVWDGFGSFPDTYSTQAKIKLIADESDGGTPCPGMATFTDPRDGQTYNTVLIGNQCWMKENLKYHTANSRCYNYSDSCNIYGRLYTWSNALSACPTGWHLPNDLEWNHLINYLTEQGFPNNDASVGSANALKSCRMINSPLGDDCNTNEHPRWEAYFSHHGFDEFGFTALPGGRHGYGSPSRLGLSGYWWSATQLSTTSYSHWIIHYNHGQIFNGGSVNAYIFSVRCIRD